jgi:hypothetical protein
LSKSGRAKKYFHTFFHSTWTRTISGCILKRGTGLFCWHLEELVTSIIRPAKESSAVILKAEGKWRLHLQGRS